MKFAHMADLHLGAWRDPRMKDKPMQAFQQAVQTCIQKEVDFVIIAGDLFNTALPGIDTIKQATTQFKKLKQAGIPTYIVAGSHDYSATGKTMLDVLEEAELFSNVMRGSIQDKKLQLDFTIDPKTQTKITGILGKANMLDKKYYEILDHTHLERQGGDKIFIFHTAIDELMPTKFAHIQSTPLSLLPKNCNYYAGGHVHIRQTQQMQNYGTLVYPGPLFPASFSEVQDLQHGGFMIVDDFVPEFIPINLHPTVNININIDNKSTTQIQQELSSVKIQPDAIVTLKLKGNLHQGTLQDLELKKHIEKWYQQGAYFVMKNTSAVTIEEFKAVHVQVTDPNALENSLIDEHAQQQPLNHIQDQKQLIKELMQVLEQKQAEGETKTTYEQRIVQAAKNIVKPSTKEETLTNQS